MLHDVGRSGLFLGSLACFCIYVIGQVEDVTVITVKYTHYSLV